jgi:hypothetical protein
MRCGGENDATDWDDGFALCAKSRHLQLVYETKLRPEERQHSPWIDRVRTQVLAAYRELERDISKQPPYDGSHVSQGFVTSAVTWRFTTYVLPDLLQADLHPHLAAHSAAAEALWEFKSSPLG